MESAYQAAMMGDSIQVANSNSSRITLTTTNPKEVKIEGYKGADFKVSTAVSIDTLELRDGALVFW